MSTGRDGSTLNHVTLITLNQDGMNIILNNTVLLVRLHFHTQVPSSDDTCMSHLSKHTILMYECICS